MRAFILSTVILSITACSSGCHDHECGPGPILTATAGDDTGGDDVGTPVPAYPEYDADGECCYPMIPGEQIDMCETHPFGRAPGCGGVEEPQSVVACYDIARLNPGLCAGKYVECREAIRIAACDECPPECAGVVGAC